LTCTGAAIHGLKGILMIDLKEVLDERTGEINLEVPFRGRLLLDCSLLNKSSAFSEEERHDFALVGLLPSRVSTLEEQVARRYQEYVQKPTDLGGSSSFVTCRIGTKCSTTDCSMTTSRKCCR
jgi:hypothetical protein